MDQREICSLKGQLTIEPFFCSTSELIVYASLWKMVNFVLIFSEVDSSARTICSCISYFHGTLSDFFAFSFVSEILLPRHPKSNFKKPTKNMKNPYIELLVDITAHNSLIFHSLFLLFCISMRMNAVAASN